jgi:hypothetical protein
MFTFQLKFMVLSKYVLNKEKNIQSTRAVKIQAGLTIQFEKHVFNFIFID